MNNNQGMKKRTSAGTSNGTFTGSSTGTSADRSTVKRILISGYYGFNNRGDEAVLWSIICALRRVSEQTGLVLQPVVLSANPSETSKQYGVEAVHRMRMKDVFTAIRQCDALISGGGSLLQDVTSAKTIPYYLAIIRMAQWMAKPTYIYAQGIGPINRPIFKRMVGRVLKKCTYVSVRDEESAQLLQSYGLDPKHVHIVSDPVMGIFPINGKVNMGSEIAESNDANEIEMDKGAPIIGVSVRYWNKDLSDLKAVADALTEIIKSRKIHIEFLPFHEPEDRKASEWVVETIRKSLKSEQASERAADETAQMIEIKHNTLPNESTITIREVDPHPEEMVRAVTRCDVLVGMRLHSLIYSIATYVPVVGVTYDPKIDHFLSRVQATPASSTEHPDAKPIYEEISARLDDGRQWIEKRRASINQLKEGADIPAQQIYQFLRI